MGGEKRFVAGGQTELDACLDRSGYGRHKKGISAQQSDGGNVNPAMERRRLAEAV